jgi:YD repeat-containing protein
MPTLAIYVGPRLLAPALGLLGMWTIRPERCTPEANRDIARVVEPERAPAVSKRALIEHYPGACRDLLDFRFPTHVGADGIPDEIVTRTFDAHGRVVTEDSVRDDAPYRMWTYIYNSAGLLEEKVGTDDKSYVNSITRYRYDHANREIEEEVDENVDGRPDWLTLKTYDARGRLATLRENVKAGTHQRGFGNWYTYDGHDRLVLQKQDNDGDGVPNLEIRFSYDDRGLLLEKHSHWYEKDGPVDEVFTYGYDVAGRLTSETDQNGFAWISRYDEAGNLVEKVHELPARLLDRTPLVRITYDYSCWQ